MLRDVIESEFIDDTVKFVTDNDEVWSRQVFVDMLKDDAFVMNIDKMHVAGSIMFIKFGLKRA